MKYQRESQDFSLNESLRAYLRKMGWKEGDNKKRNEFAQAVGISEITVAKLITNNNSIGPQLQARLYIGTGDSQFQPRNELEKKALEEWQNNPTPPKLVVLTGDRALAQSPKPDNPFYLHEQLVRLFSEHSIGKKGREQSMVARYLRISRSSLLEILKKQHTFTVGLKVRLFLGFCDSAYKPLNENEQARCEFWRKQIPRPLPFIKTEPPIAPDEQVKIITRLPYSDLAEQLLADEKFLTQLAVKIGSRLAPRQITPPEPKAPAPEPTAETPVAETFPEGEVIPASFVKETAALLSQTISKLNTIVSLSNTSRKEVQTEMETLFKKLENALVECLLLARASARTATREAAFQMLQGERGFIERMKKSGLTNKQ